MLLTALGILALALLVAAVIVTVRRRRPRDGGATPSERSVPRERPPPVARIEVASSESAPIPDSLLNLSVLAEAQVDAAGRETLETICAAFREPHPVQRRLATGLDEPEDLIEVVSTDAGLSADVLRTVNSAAFALVEPITSAPQAVNFLGVSIVKALLLRATMLKSLESQSAERDRALLHVWQSACAASAMARLLGLELGLPRPSILGTKTLFCNIGDVAMLRCVPGAEDWYREGSSVVDRIQQQQGHCGLNAALVGTALIRQWALPEEIGETIATSYLPLVETPVGHHLRGDARIENVLVYLACVIGDRMTYHGLRDVALLDLTPGAEPELFWLGAHLHAARLGRVPELLQSPGFSRKANRVLGTFADKR